MLEKGNGSGDVIIQMRAELLKQKAISKKNHTIESKFQLNQFIFKFDEPTDHYSSSSLICQIIRAGMTVSQMVKVTSLYGTTNMETCSI